MLKEGLNEMEIKMSMCIYKDGKYEFFIEGENVKVCLTGENDFTPEQSEFLIENFPPCVMTSYSEESCWKPFVDCPRDVEIDTYGEFRPHHSDKIFPMRFANYYISSNTPYPLTATNQQLNGMSGTYIRTHWRYITCPY
jgi:hypothetical protein